MTTSTSSVQGNASPAQKQFVLDTFPRLTCKVYGSETAVQLGLMEVNLHAPDSDGGQCWAETVFELEVTKPMCNTYGSLHGACAAYIADVASYPPLWVLGDHLGIDGVGISVNMNLCWHKPAMIGSCLRIASTTLAFNGKIRTSRCEIRSKSGELIASATVTSMGLKGHHVERTKL